eukprot:1394869-Amorphochlora_amoeboformis.AAC.1
MAPKLCSLRLIFVLTCVPAAPTVVSSLSPRALFSPRGTRVQNEKTRIMRAQSSPRKADVTIPQTRPLSNVLELSDLISFERHVKRSEARGGQKRAKEREREREREKGGGEKGERGKGDQESKEG